MNKKELIGNITDLLQVNNIKKPLYTKRHTFHVTDDNGNSADFVVNEKSRTVLYTVEDVNNIIDACLSVITESLKRGEEVSIRGFGSFGLHCRAARRTKIPGTEDWCDIEARYVPKFYFGNDLRLAARLYELALEEKYDNMQDSDFEDGEDQ